MVIKVFANFREICQAKSLEIPCPEGSTVHEILETLIQKFPGFKDEVLTEERKLKPFVHVFLNGKNIVHTDGLETKVYSQDEMALFPPVAGG